MLLERAQLSHDIDGKELSPIESYIEKYASAYRIKNISSLFQLYEGLKKKYTNSLPIFLFEFIGQCEYTSMHTTLNNFYRNSPDYNELQQFKFTLDKLEQSILTIDEIKTELLYTEKFSVLKKVNENPYPFLDEIKIKLCPTNNSVETFASTPNGYFTGDLQPYENYALIKHLQHSYKYDFLGIGSVFLLFKNNEPLSEKEATLLIQDLSKIYKLESNFIDTVLFEHLTSKNYLLLPYADNLEDFTADLY